MIAGTRVSLMSFSSRLRIKGEYEKSTPGGGFVGDAKTDTSPSKNFFYRYLILNLKKQNKTKQNKNDQSVSDDLNQHILQKRKKTKQNKTNMMLSIKFFVPF
jgi:hypothetical protein